MKIINNKGKEFLENYFHSKYKVRVQFDKGNAMSFSRDNLTAPMKSDLNSRSVNYNLSNQKVTIYWKQYERMLDETMFDEIESVYTNEFVKVATADMDQQWLSNIAQYAVIKAEINPDSVDELKEQMNTIKNVIFPELDRRFKGELLAYEPWGDWDRKMYNQYLKKTQTNV